MIPGVWPTHFSFFLCVPGFVERDAGTCRLSLSLSFSVWERIFSSLHVSIIMTHVFFFFLLPCLDGEKKNLPPIFRNDVMGATRRKEKKYFVLPSLSPPAIVLPRYPQALVTLVYIDPVPLLTSKDKNVRVYHFYFVVL
jgi:hypothetical protein